MVVRTISQLPAVDHNGMTQPSQSYVEVSIPSELNNGKYISRKTSVTELNKIATDNLSVQLVSDYQLNLSSGSRISLRDQANKITNLQNGNITFSGLKTFAQFPKCAATYPTTFTAYGSEDNLIPNVGHIQKMINMTPAFMSTTDSMIAEGCPFKTFRGKVVDTEAKSICYREFQDSDEFYYWKIADGEQDSANTIYDGTSSSQKHYVKIRDTGYLVVWGWLTDGGSVAADMAWVGLFAKMKAQGDKNTMLNIPLQIQPWIQGSKSTDMQYIGFGIPVREGLELNIRTGFAVSGGSNGAFQRDGSMTFKDGWIANSFVGYVIKNQTTDMMS